MDKGQQLWDSISSQYKTTGQDSPLNNASYYTTSDDNIIYIYAEKPLDLFKLNRFFKADLESKLSALDDSYTLKFIGLEDKNKLEQLRMDKQKEVEEEMTPTSPWIAFPLKPEYTFENFMPGQSNRLALQAAMQVANATDVFAIPLYIFGDVGLGKTHLMQAVGNSILLDHPNARIIYTSALDFAEDYYLATAKAAKTQAIQAFYDKYQKADVLLMDDIQFLEKKEKTQEEFFKVFENLAAFKKKIVITCDRPATDLSIMPRLVSRLQWGYMVDIKKPDKALRISILRHKAQYMMDDPSQISDEILGTIADYFTSNVRELEGALRRFIVYCTSLNLPFTVQNCYECLEAVLPKDVKKDNNDPIQIVNFVSNATTEYFHVSVGDMTSDSRKKQVAYARQITMYILKNHYNMSIKDISANFGKRDHSTVGYSIAKIETDAQSNALIRQDIENILAQLDKKD